MISGESEHKTFVDVFEGFKEIKQILHSKNDPVLT